MERVVGATGSANGNGCRTPSPSPSTRRSGGPAACAIAEAVRTLRGVGGVALCAGGRNVDRAVKVVAGGFVATEAARWFGGALWFVDQQLATVQRLTEGGVERLGGFARPMSIGFRPSGEMLVADLGTSGMTPGDATDRRSPPTIHVFRDGTKVDAIDLSAFAGVNDMTVDRQGRAYVDVFSASSGDGGSLGNEVVGQVLLIPPDGEPRVVAEDIVAANGIGISPDGRTLVVGETWGPDGRFASTRLFRFDVEPDGSLTNRRVEVTVEDGCCDGLCFDAEGAIWLSTASGGEVLRLVHGQVVDRIRLPDGRWPLACALGGVDLRTLYICSVEPPPRADPAVSRNGWDLTGFRRGFIEAVEVDVPGPAT